MNWIYRLVLCICLAAIGNSTVSAQDDYAFFVNEDWVFGGIGGYVPFELTVRTANGKTVDRDHKLNLCVNGGYNQRGRVFTTPLVIEQGQSSGHARLLFAADGKYQNLTWWVEKDMNCRVDQRDLIIRSQPMTGGARGTDSQSYLFVSSTVKKVVKSQVQNQRGFGVVSVVSGTGGGAASNIGTNLPSFEVLADILPDRPVMGISTMGDAGKPIALSMSCFGTKRPVDLPTNWVELSAVQNIFISLSDLDSLAKSDPIKVAALKKWVACGGRLVVNGCGAGGQRAPEIHDCLGTSGGKRSEWKWLSQSAWLFLSQQSTFLSRRKISPGIAAQFSPGTQVDPGNQVDLGLVQDSPLFVKESIQKEGEAVWKSTGRLPAVDPELPAEDQQVPAIYQSCAQGTIVAVDGDMTDWKQPDWARLLATVDLIGADNQRLVGTRMIEGFTIGEVKIPGVTEPPKIAFQILIGCFVLIAGPLNYFVLRRMNRLNVLLFTVPVISFFACVLLVTYALVTQGFGYKIRHDSVTFLDQHAQMAVTRSHSTVYCGVNPGNHVFSDDRYVLVASQRRSGARAHFRNGEIEVSGGEVRPRNPYQISVIDSYATAQGLKVVDEGSELFVKSGFEDKITLLVVVRDGKWYQIDDLMPGGTARVKPMASSKVEINYKSAMHVLKGEPRRTMGKAVYGISNHLVWNEQMPEFEDGQGYVAVMEKFQGARPIHEEPDSIGGVHLVIGNW